MYDCMDACIRTVNIAHFEVLKRNSVNKQQVYRPLYMNHLFINNYVCVNKYIHACMHIYAHRCRFIYRGLYTCIFITHSCTHSVYVYACLHIIYVCVYICMYVRTVCMYIYVCMGECM